VGGVLVGGGGGGGVVGWGVWGGGGGGLELCWKTEESLGRGRMKKSPVSREMLSSEGRNRNRSGKLLGAGRRTGKKGKRRRGIQEAKKKHGNGNKRTKSTISKEPHYVFNVRGKKGGGFQRKWVSYQPFSKSSDLEASRAGDSKGRRGGAIPYLRKSAAKKRPTRNIQYGGGDR